MCPGEQLSAWERTRKMSDIDFGRYMVSNECDFCKVYNEQTLHRVERVFLQNRISYFIRQQDWSLLSFLFSNNKMSCVFRINQRDVARASYLISDIRGIDILTDAAQEDWSPKAQLARRNRYMNA